MSTLSTARTALWHLRRGGVAGVRRWNARRRAEIRFATPAQARGVEGAWTGRGSRRRLSFNPAPLPEPTARRADLRVGVILDEFSAHAFAHEWSAVPLDPRTWQEQLKDGLDLVFVESAWAGNNRLWRGKLAGPTGPDGQLVELLAACRRAGVPTVFWNKEDPPHYDDFLPAARLFDFVFTTDSGRLEAYHRDLGHERVGVLPFAAQPAIHNPVRPRHGRHSRDVAFAGMYFAHKYPERREQMDMLLGGAADASGRLPTGLEIFSRRLGGEPEYQFPAPLDSRVVGSLSYPQMLSAYKAYRLFLNVNSVTDSPSMCARRIFEISAAGTPVLTAPSAAVSNFFPETEVPVARTREDAERLTRALVRSPELNDHTVHLAQRRIWREHTYAHRVETVLEAVLPARARPVELPSVTALVPTIRPHQVEHVFRSVAAQEDVRAQLVLLTHGFELPADRLLDLREKYPLADVVVLQADGAVPLGACLNRCAEAADGEVLAKMDDDDHYGPQYLADQLRALSYSGADIVGKQAHYMHLAASNATILRFAEREHRFTDLVMGPTILTRREVLKDNPFPELGLGEDTGFLRSAAAGGLSIYSADRFNYFQIRSGHGHTWQASDYELLATGELKFYGGPHEHTDI